MSFSLESDAKPDDKDACGGHGLSQASFLFRGASPMTRFTTALVASLTALVPVLPAAGAERPNVVVILADDQGWGDLSVHGNTNLSTPSIDSLARDGALFERFYVCPVCSPTRAEFLTGRYHPRGGVWNVTTGGERLNLDEKTIADVFKGAGYATALFGKWHNGSQYPYHPNARGFEEFYGFTSGHWGDYFDPPLEHNDQLVRGKGYLTDDLTDHALAFVEKNRTRPFFCYVAFNTPHSPMQVPDRWYTPFKDRELKLLHEGPQREDPAMTRAALAMCENIDFNVGRVLQKLKDTKLEERTIVLYFSDNGPNSWRWNGGMKGRKGSTDEGGVRVPLLVRWPGHIKPGMKVPQIAAAIDLLPTLASWAGITLPAGKPLDGVNLAPLFFGEDRPWPDRMIFSHWNGNVSVRTQKHRLDAAGKLYDMTKDPSQQRDIAKEDLEKTRLTEAVARWKRDVLSNLKREDRPFTVGYREFPRTHLPARDGVPHGTVRRSARAPNCSFFTNWTATDDRITWDIDVATTGRYEVVLHYTCPKDDIGSRIEVGFKDSRLEGAVTEAHDPPLVGAEHDRVPRDGESYVKDFKPLRLGVMTLEKGRGLLTLRALQVAGKQVMDVRAVSLTLQP
jgi:arylsulfatase A-like enzyme